MYDLAKRSLAFAVATGGLLLTGTAFSPALAVEGSDAIQGPAQAQGVRNDAGSASSPVNAAPRDATATAGFRARGAQAPPGLLPPESLRTPVSASGARDAVAGGAASGPTVVSSAGTPVVVCGGQSATVVVKDGGTVWTYCVTGSGSSAYGASAGGAGQSPASTVIQACEVTVQTGPAEGVESGSSCTNTAEGSAPTVPGAPAPGTGGASATAFSVHDVTGVGGLKIIGRSGGAGSAGAGTAGAGTVGVPANAVLAACDAAQAGATGDAQGGKCAPTAAWPSPAPSACKCPPSPIHPPPPPPPPNRHPWKCRCSHTSPSHPPAPPPGRRPWKCGCAPTSPPPPPPPPSSPPPSSPPPPPPSGWPSPKCTCSPTTPASSPPSWPSSSPRPSWPGSPPSWPSASPSWPSSSPWHHPGGPPHNGNGNGNGNGGGLAHTGTDIGIALGVAGAALLGGLGLRAAARRREGGL